eukprot:GHVS01035084.1.p2 GENE.GHVS01035084.1~~GHVS01035084.1.p2  ORF type:complete len:236 (+),score=44.35 GHVS01035084.1:993-1700(+)
MQGGGYNPAYPGLSAADAAAIAHHYNESQMEYRQQQRFCCLRPLKSLFCCIPLRAALYLFAVGHIVGIFGSLVITGSSTLPSSAYWLLFSVRFCYFLFSIAMAGLVLKAAQLPATETTVDIMTACCFMQTIVCVVEFLIVGICCVMALVLLVSNPRPLNGWASGFLELELQAAALVFVPACLSLHFAHVYWSYGVKVSNQRRAIIQSLILRDGGGWTHPSAPMAFSNDQDAALLH